MMAVLLAAVLCDPCSRAWHGHTLSDTPVLKCAAFSKSAYWTSWAQGVALLARPAGATQWELVDLIPHHELENDRGEVTVYVPGLDLLGPQHPDDPRKYRTTTLPYHRFADLPAGEVWELAITAFNINGHLEPMNVECTDCGQACGYVRVCIYPVQTVFPTQGGLPCQG